MRRPAGNGDFANDQNRIEPKLQVEPLLQMMGASRPGGQAAWKPTLRTVIGASRPGRSSTVYSDGGQ